ncbi:MAG: hypothetical protein M3527_09690 [Actinomycetota bacterium]|nr:hypothetical protein [Acidimicrobiia bacterium]MDQ3294702.1 hypothetical protein [Actinomycetota bacterium]
MRSVDVRTRTGADVRAVDTGAFFEDELPALLASRSAVAVPGARALKVRPFAFDVEGRAWTLALADDDTLTVRPGLDDAAAIAKLDAVGLHDLVNDLRTPMGFFTGGDLDMPLGRLEHFLDWWVVLRSVLDDRPAHTPGAVDLREPDGEPLDLGRSFTLDDDPEAISHFLAEAGFLHLTGVFDETEMAAVSAEMDAAVPGYAQGDGRSWWAKTHDGVDRLVRMQRFQVESPTAASILADERL